MRQTLNKKKILNLALPPQIPHPSQAKDKFPTPGKAYSVKFPTLRARENNQVPGLCPEGVGVVVIVEV